MLGAYGLAMAITHIASGQLADRIRRRPLLIAARLIGPLIGGWIGDTYGMSFFAAAGVLVPANIAMWFIEDEPIDRRDPETPPASLIRNKRLIVLLSVMAIALFSIFLHSRSLQIS